MNYMRLSGLRPLRVLVALSLLTLFVSPPAFAQGKQDFTLVNATGIEIHELYVSPHKSDDWEEDILGQDTLPEGESVAIHFSPKDKAKLWDLKIVDKDGHSVEWESLNLLEIAKVTLHYKKGRAWADIE